MRKTEIIERCTELFSRYGIKAVNMDDIAASMHISKSTLYELFDSKEELAKACLIGMYTRFLESLRNISNVDSVEESLFGLIELCLKNYSTFYQINPAFYGDILKYDIKDIRTEHRAKITEEAKSVYDKFVAQGIFKDSDDFFLLNTMWWCYNGHNCREDVDSRISPEEFGRTLWPFLTSLCTNQGKEILNSIYSRYQKNDRNK